MIERPAHVQLALDHLVSCFETMGHDARQAFIKAALLRDTSNTEPRLVPMFHTLASLAAILDVLEQDDTIVRLAAVLPMPT